MAKRTPLSERFWPKVCIGDECWLWTGGLSSDGYGSIGEGGRKGRVVGAHRASWFLEHGAWPDEHVLHTCDNPSCVRPSHLFLGSHADNMADCKAKGRKAKLAGESNPSARLSAAEVSGIRSLREIEGWTYRRLADKYGVGKSTIGRILRGTHWKHVAG